MLIFYHIMTICLSITFIFISVIATLLFASSDHDITSPKNISGSVNGNLVEIGMPGGTFGPESFAFDVIGCGPYMGVSDGRIILWKSYENQWVDFAVTSAEREGCEGAQDQTQRENICGRPLGLGFNKRTGCLYIADAYMGLMEVGPEGGLAWPVSKEADGVPFKFTNSLDIDHASGIIYFTDSSTIYSRRDWLSVMITGDDTGRLLQFNPITKKTSVLVKNLKFPNGVALSKTGLFLLFVETTTCNLYKLWLKTPKAGTVELLAKLSGFPDNIKRNSNGEFWVAINRQSGIFVKWILSNTWIGNFGVIFFPVDFTKWYVRLARLIEGTAMGVKLNEDGIVVGTFGKGWESVSEVHEYKGDLWVGSVTSSFMIKEKYLGDLKIDVSKNSDISI